MEAIRIFSLGLFDYYVLHIEPLEILLNLQDMDQYYTFDNVDVLQHNMHRQRMVLDYHIYVLVSKHQRHMNVNIHSNHPSLPIHHQLLDLFHLLEHIFYSDTTRIKQNI